MSEQNPHIPKLATGTGSAPLLAPDDRAALKRLGYRQRLLLKQQDPRRYQSLKEE